MSSTLSPLAIHHILSFTEQDYRRRKPNLKNAARVPQVGLMARHVCPTWGLIYELYFSGKRPPLLDYLRSPELLLKFKDDLDYRDMRDVFGHGKPIVFDDDIPQRFVSKLVQAFVRLREEPSSLNVTAVIPYAKVWRTQEAHCSTATREVALMGLSDVWPEVYAVYLPCAECTTLESMFESSSIMPRFGPSSRQSTKCVVEIFHVFSNHFDKKLTLELTFVLGTPEKYKHADVLTCPAAARKPEKMELRQVVMYLDEKTCSPLAVGTTRKRKSLLLHPDLAPEVYGFLDRVHVGTSLTANSALNQLISRLKNRLSMHHLMCEFKADGVEHSLRFEGACWLTVHHFRRDLSYTDVRRLKVPGAEGPSTDCALILHNMSNSYVVDLKVPYSNSRFSLKMLAALVDRNFSVGRLRMHALDGPLTDYRSLEVVFCGSLRLGALDLRIRRKSLVNLIKTTNFLRMPTIQGLTELRLILAETRRGLPSRTSCPAEYPRRVPRHRLAVVRSSLWIAGIYLLSNCAHFEVNYGPDRHMQSAVRKLVRVCEKFERGEITEIVERFKFTVSDRLVSFPFNARNRIASTSPVEGRGFYAARCTWDVYRFRNAATGEWLTACVGHRESYSSDTVLHIAKGELDLQSVKGEDDPDAMNDSD
ncbi:hypothetical protein AAVH_15935 [Aphelenchoides avenae]|nr:hypothetical protein AAVH_15935 [Aphelenchus avenae]